VSETLSFPYVKVSNALGEVTPRPLLPITLMHQNQVQETLGLLDSGADVNVLPFQIGLQLGLIWEAQRHQFQLSGNLANFEARGVILSATVGAFPPVRLAFAWTRASTVSLILGQVNFFMEYDVCFSRSDLKFELRAKS